MKHRVRIGRCMRNEGERSLKLLKATTSKVRSGYSLETGFMDEIKYQRTMEMFQGEFRFGENCERSSD